MKYTSTSKVIDKRTTTYVNSELSCDACGFKETDWTRMDRHLSSHEFRDLESETNWEECEYPSMGVAAENGSVEFKDKEQADKFFELLQKIHAGYTVGDSYWFELDWDGPGEYNVIPEWSSDYRDNSISYSTTITKKEEL